METPQRINKDGQIKCQTPEIYPKFCSNKSNPNTIKNTGQNILRRDPNLFVISASLKPLIQIFIEI